MSAETPTPPPPAPSAEIEDDDAARTASHTTNAAAAHSSTTVKPDNPGYHYWHSTVASGAGAAPKPEPKLLAAEAAPTGPEPKTITSFAFLDDEDVIKVYVTLEGDLAGVVAEDISATFNKEKFNDNCSMEVMIKAKGLVHRLAAEKLGGVIVPEECKWKITKKSPPKLIVSLKKADPRNGWSQLRANVVLPYRRGGGG